MLSKVTKHVQRDILHSCFNSLSAKSSAKCECATLTGHLRAILARIIFYFKLHHDFFSLFSSIVSLLTTEDIV